MVILRQVLLTVLSCKCTTTKYLPLSSSFLLQRCEIRIKNANLFLQVCQNRRCIGIGGRYVICLDVSVDCRCHEEQDDERAHDNADDAQAGQPFLVVPTHGLEHAPEAMNQVEPQEHEPDEVQGEQPPALERREQQVVRILRFQTQCGDEFAELHLCPEVHKMEADASEDDDAEHKHVLCAPTIVLCLGGHGVTLDASPADIVLDGEPDTVNDMDSKAQGQDGNHYVDDGSGHKVAAKLEPAVARREQSFVRCRHAELTHQRVDNREEIDGAVKQQEHKKECAAYALDELLAN